MIKKLAQFFFFGNYFLGLCIAMLSVETLVQNGVRVFHILYFILVLLLTVLYYTYAYATEIRHYKGTNIRIQWYVRNRAFIRTTQKVYTVAIACILIYFFIKYYQGLLFLSVLNWCTLLIFPLLACLYYGTSMQRRIRFSLRNYGWLKPFVIGFVATGAVTIYPLLFTGIVKGEAFYFTAQEALYFLVNFMFTTVIAIMFDIKDYASDYNHHLKTLIVRFGLRRSIYYVLLPLIGIGMVAFILFAVNKRYTVFHIIINCIPFFLLASVAWSLQQRKKILYYLAVIDGLLLVKAIFGIASIVLFS